MGHFIKKNTYWLVALVSGESKNTMLTSAPHPARVERTPWWDRACVLVWGLLDGWVEKRPNTVSLIYRCSGSWIHFHFKYPPRLYLFWYMAHFKRIVIMVKPLCDPGPQSELSLISASWIRCCNLECKVMFNTGACAHIHTCLHTCTETILLMPFQTSMRLSILFHRPTGHHFSYMINFGVRRCHNTDSFKQQKTWALH